MRIQLLYLAFKIYCFIFRPVRMGVRVLMFKDSSVWMVRHTYIPGWHLPGGGIKRNETIEQAARREMFEETGARAGELKLLGVYTSYIQWKTDHSVLFLCTDFEISGSPDGEIAEMRSFPLDQLPGNVYPSHLLRLEDLRAGRIPAQFGEW